MQHPQHANKTDPWSPVGIAVSWQQLICGGITWNICHPHMPKTSAMVWVKVQGFSKRFKYHWIWLWHKTIGEFPVDMWSVIEAFWRPKGATHVLIPMRWRYEKSTWRTGKLGFQAPVVPFQLESGSWTVYLRPACSGVPMLQRISRHYSLIPAIILLCNRGRGWHSFHFTYAHRGKSNAVDYKKSAVRTPSFPLRNVIPSNPAIN